MTKRNPCRYLIETFDETGHLIKTWRRGYAQERKTIDGVEMTFVMEGGDTGVGHWYLSQEVEMTKGKWSNKTKEVISKKSFWNRSKK
tara:strand:- start:156 stop:416 length:261 start_codon:yes stop_codon:yes gene_type:complete